MSATALTGSPTESYLLATRNLSLSQDENTKLSGEMAIASAEVCTLCHSHLWVMLYLVLDIPIAASRSK